MKFHENLSGGSRVVSCIQMDGDSGFNKHSARLRTHIKKTHGYQNYTVQHVKQHFMAVYKEDNFTYVFIQKEPERFTVLSLLTLRYVNFRALLL
jgi:hypothetical protein